MNDDFDVFYTPAEESFLPKYRDKVEVREDGVLVGFYWKLTKEQMEEKYKKEIFIGKWSDLSKIMEDALWEAFVNL